MKKSIFGKKLLTSLCLTVCLGLASSAGAAGGHGHGEPPADIKVKNGEMAVVGAVYDSNDNYGRGRGSLIITNFNDESDPNSIMGHDLLKELSKADIINHVGSLAPSL